MTIVDKLLIRQAIELSAVIGDHSETIFNLTNSFLKAEYNMEYPQEVIHREVEREATSRLFFACGKNKPQEIKNPYNCLRIARDLWLDYYLAKSSNYITLKGCLKMAEEKFLAEKQLNPNINFNQSPLNETIKKIFGVEGAVLEYKNKLENTVQYFQVAFYVLDEFFSTTTAKECFALYNPFININPKEEISIQEDFDEKNKAKIKYLEKTIHDLKVKLDHAQKDAVREIIMSLAASSYGSPLFELHSIKKDSTTPEHISATISNLFLALENLDVRITKDNLVGKELSLEDILEGKFCIQNNDLIEANDTVRVKYPGIKLGKEMIVKPTVIKEK